MFTIQKSKENHRSIWKEAGKQQALKLHKKADKIKLQHILKIIKWYFFKVTAIKKQPQNFT